MMREKMRVVAMLFFYCLCCLVVALCCIPIQLVYAILSGKKRVLKFCVALVAMIVLEPTMIYAALNAREADFSPSVSNDDYVVSLATRRKGDDTWHYGRIQVNPGDTIEVMASYGNIGEQTQRAYALYDYNAEGGLKYVPGSEAFKNAEHFAVAVNQDWTMHQLTAGAYEPGEGFSFYSTFEVPDNYFDTREYLTCTNQLEAGVCVVRMIDGEADTANSLWLMAITEVRVVPKLAAFWLSVVKNGYWSLIVMPLVEAFLLWLIILIVPADRHMLAQKCSAFLLKKLNLEDGI